MLTVAKLVSKVLLHAQLLQTDCTADDINNSIDSADFMKMHVIQSNLVNVCFRVTEAAAINASLLVGRGDEKAADAAAVEATTRELVACLVDPALGFDCARAKALFAPAASVPAVSVVAP